jgi:aspartyl protease family protein
MMKQISYLILFLFLVSCSSNNSFTASKILNGNTIVLNNGITVNLINVSNNESNIKILEHYLVGGILLFNANNDEITQFSSDNISAIIYNSDGDCINELLAGVSKITPKEIPIINDNTDVEKTIVSFEHENGILKIPVIINGIELYFIFDTGASLITISNQEASFLYKNGKLLEKDLIGRSQFIDANGDISEGTIINLTSVRIGNRELQNVQACVIEGQNAPLLFGQSALQKFGKVSIDYAKNEISFE